MSQRGSLRSSIGNLPPGLIQTINGDTGSITGTTVTIYAHNSVNHSGSSVKFVNAGTVSTLNFTDSNGNTLLGQLSGNLTLTGAQNVGIYASLSSVTNGSQNTGINAALGAVTTGGTNTGIGFGAGSLITTGSGNIAIGYFAEASTTGNNNIVIQGGSNYILAESNNISIGNLGVANESNVMRLGTTGSGAVQVNKTFVAAINGVTAVGSPVAVSSTGQLSDLGFGSSSQVLTSNGAGVSPTWQAPASIPVSGVFGDGSDGSPTFDGSTVILGITPSANNYTLTRDLFLASPTLNTGITITTQGRRIYCNGTFTNNGTILSNGLAGTGAQGGGAAAVIGSTLGLAAGATAGGSGQTGVGSVSTAASNSYGGAGGNGGAGGSAGGVAGLTALPNAALGSMRSAPNSTLGALISASTATPLITALGAGTGGGGGGGDATHKGGGGGGGGGYVFITSLFFAGTGTIEALGGNGGAAAAAGTNCGGGGGGGGGFVLINSRSVVSNAISGQTISVAGGALGTPTGSGLNGVAGSSGISILLPA